MGNNGSIRWLLLAIMLVSTACTPGGGSEIAVIRDAKPANRSYAVMPNQALIVFLRPSGFGDLFDAPIFDVTDGKPKFVASIPDRAKLAYYLEPGEKTLMVVGQNADFVRIDVDRAKIYYIMVSPSYAPASTRFYFRTFNRNPPFHDHRISLDSSRFSRWYERSRWVENVPAATDAGAVRKYLADIQAKMVEWLPLWEKRELKASLDRNDGAKMPYQ